MPAHTPGAELLAQLAEVLDRLGLTWCVFGAQAVVIHGVPRMTADVDVTVDLPEEKLAQTIEELLANGFESRVPDLSSFAMETHVIPLVHRETAMPADLVLAGTRLEQDFLARATRRDVGGLKVPVISVEDLVVIKLLAGRAKDVDDARHLLRRKRKDLDSKRVRKLLAEIQAALDRSDLIPLFEKLRTGGPSY